MDAVNLTPLINAAFEILAVGVTALGGFALTQIGKFFGVEVDGQRMAQITGILDDGVHFAKRQVVGQDGEAEVDFNNRLANTAVDFVVSSAPKLLKQLNADPDTPKGREKITNWVHSRLD
jgi:hypothetical protein